MTRSSLLTIIGLSLLGWVILGLAAAFLRFSCGVRDGRVKAVSVLRRKRLSK